MGRHPGDSGEDAEDVAVDSGGTYAEADARNGPCCVGPDPRDLLELLQGGGEDDLEGGGGGGLGKRKKVSHGASHLQGERSDDHITITVCLDLTRPSTNPFFSPPHRRS